MVANIFCSFNEVTSMMISKPANKQPEPNTKQLLLAARIWANLIHSIIHFHSFSPSLPVVREGPANLILKLNRPGNQLSS